MTGSKITVTPNPVAVGGTITVCVESEPTPWNTTIHALVEIDGEFDDELKHVVEVDDTHPCFTYVIPADCTGVTIHSPERWSDDIGVVVLPD
jgi:hypothetical protein